MKKLIRIEWGKTWNYNVFRILGLIYIVSFLISIFVLPFIEVKTQLTDQADILDIKSFYTFPIIWSSYAYLASKANIFLAIIVIFLAGNEYSFRTFRQQVIDGLSREELLLGKLLIIGAIALANTILLFVLGWIFGLVYSADFSFVEAISEFYMLGIYFVQAVAYMIIALFVVIWLRNKTLSIVVFLAYSVLIEPILRLILNKKVWSDFGLYMPMKVTTKLTPIPNNGLVEFIKVNGELNGFGGSLPLGVNLLLAVVYAGIFYMIARAILLKRDL